MSRRLLVPCFYFLCAVVASACGSSSNDGATGASDSGPAGSASCAVHVPDSGASVVDGGFWWNDPGGDVLNLDWTCATDSYEMICACNELDHPPDPQCSCLENGTRTTTFTWACDRSASPAALPAQCGFPTAH